MDEAIRAAVAAHRFSVDPGSFADFAAVCVSRAGTVAHVGDLLVVFAFVAGDPAAARTLDGVVERVAGRVHARVRTGLSRAELAQELRVHFLVPCDEAPARLHAFRGRSSLERYLFVAATRHALNLCRGKPREVPFEDAFFASSPELTTPEVRLLVERHGSQVRASLARALARIDGRAKSLLWLSVVEGATDEHVARIHGVHRTTAARWIVAAREALRRELEEDLVASPGLAATELSSLVRAVLAT